MTDRVTFRARARTIDHLGRGQIADTPTAVSELWKNAYDAYATSVALQIFDGEPPCAVVFDDGAGMSRADVVERWLVLGTESKIEEASNGSTPVETFGLPPRAKQGEKGIGRLSVAFLAPATLLISKRRGDRYVAVLVDWRLFENPFIDLEDVTLPIEEFDGADDLSARLPAMVEVLRSNVEFPEVIATSANSTRGPQEVPRSGDRQSRLRAGWERFAKYERAQPNFVGETREAVCRTWKRVPLSQRHLAEWPAFAGLSDHGTALFLIDVHHELAVWARPEGEVNSDEEAIEVQRRLRETLMGFTDPYAEDRPQIDYEVAVNRHGRYSRVLGTQDVFGRDDLVTLEHLVDGSFDERGVFRGKVVVFGKDRGSQEIVPLRPPPTTGRERVGPFELSIGTFEQEPRSSTHSPEQHAILLLKAEEYGGVTVYRDGLRVMPYGRAQSDFFGIEERRGKHAGREFWAHRRTFGRVAFTRDHNPNLRDKAGREGLVENRANRELRMLVVNVLQQTARRYFGTDSKLRQEILPEVQKQNAAARESAERARARRRKSVRRFLKERRTELDTALEEAGRLIRRAGEARTNRDPSAASLISSRYQELVTVRSMLRPPPVPARFEDYESDYRSYRDNYREFSAQLEELGKAAAELEAEVGAAAPLEVARSNFSSQQSALAARVDRWLREVESRLDALRAAWRERASEDRARFYKAGQPVLHALESGDEGDLAATLNRLDLERRELDTEFAARYEAIVRALDHLADDIDVEGALAIVDDDRMVLEDRIRNINAVAQVGITVEIIGHEFEVLDAEVRRNLLRLPEAARTTSAYKQAFEAHAALADRLRFLSPLRIAGYRSRQDISGSQIADYVEEFFARSFRDNRIDFVVTPAFRSLRVNDLPSRVYPVFLNLVNNAVYWVSQGIAREIRLDLVDGLVVVADTGRGVDPDDVPRLFELFFSRRRDGRGVGLYLSRVNLAVARHSIRYAQADDPHALPGANFIIEFRGLTTDA